MNFSLATKAAHAGKYIKSSIWDNCLREGVHGNLEFVKSVQVYGRTYDRSYDPTPIDRNSSDWEIAQ